MSDKIPVITIDGPASSGKGTIAIALAHMLGWHFLDSGAIYRILAYHVIKNKIDPTKQDEVLALIPTISINFKIQYPQNFVFSNDENISLAIREENCSITSSIIAKNEKIRHALLQKQRDFRQMPGLIADGRDMGTVVFPDAFLKIFLTASAFERAKRRYNQFLEIGDQVDFQVIYRDLQERDERDKSRQVAPLVAANDAYTIDTTNLTPDEVLGKIKNLLVAKNVIL